MRHRTFAASILIALLAAPWPAPAQQGKGPRVRIGERLQGTSWKVDTIDGKAVPKLSETQTTLKDVPVTAAALLARPAAQAPAAASPTVTTRPGVPTKVAAARPAPAAQPSTAPAAQAAPETSTVSQ